MSVRILAIETSCDETGVAVIESSNASKGTIIYEALASQIAIHTKTQGVVPEVAAREHTYVLPGMIRDAMQTVESIDMVAVTVGPGLMPALSVGVAVARTLAYTRNIPIIPIHHIEGHIYSALPDTGDIFPCLALIVSGGHTMLVEVRAHLDYTVIGQTRDDAAGEVFDKVARMLGLPYPGGPHVSALAQQGDTNKIAFPRPMVASNNLDFSFSGLKTSVLYTLRDHPEYTKEDIAASFEEAVVDTLTIKVHQAAQRTEYKVLLLAGGVAANTSLRSRMQELAHSLNTPLHMAEKNMCGDNAVMIAKAALHAYAGGRKRNWKNTDAYARVDLEKANDL